MSLINEALKRARGEAQRQNEAERAGTAPAPAWTPPPFSRRERSPVWASVFASLTVSALVLGLGYYFSRNRAGAETASPASAAPLLPAPTPPAAAPVQPARSASAPAPTSAKAAAGVATAPTREPAKEPAERSAKEPPAAAALPAAPEPQAVNPARGRETPSSTAATGATTTPPAPPAAHASTQRAGGLAGKTFVREVTLPGGARIELGGIISGTTPLAMLNGHVVGIGEFVENCSVAKVEARRVEMHGPDGTFWIELQ